MARIRSLVPVLLGCLVLPGCGAGQGEVRGTVRYEGKPLPFGTIQFLPADGVPRAARIEADGSYVVTLPVGTAKVIISCVDAARLHRATAQLRTASGRAAPPVQEMVSLIPAAYADWNTSGLRVLVEDGSTVQDFALRADP